MIVASQKLERIPVAKKSNVKISDFKEDFKNVLIDWVDGWDHGKTSTRLQYR